MRTMVADGTDSRTEPIAADPDRWRPTPTDPD
ncbi:hypothetical protein SMF913_12527 [Streptomyces malaysiensis]|uniref:Uncharacterized protein n=1 Tax=Streptomyces malaysiensis TaxID=92644 RepID=A0A2J7Z8A4_STRMQ|nr:hypothetical protein SMF913_12527 [Streptomyces malaysiensis]